MAYVMSVDPDPVRHMLTHTIFEYSHGFWSLGAGERIVLIL